MVGVELALLASRSLVGVEERPHVLLPDLHQPLCQTVEGVASAARGHVPPSFNHMAQ